MRKQMKKLFKKLFYCDSNHFDHSIFVLKKTSRFVPLLLYIKKNL